MKKLFLSVAVSALSAGAFASQAAVMSDADFAGKLNAVTVTAAENVKADKAEIAPVEAAARPGSYVRVSGYVNLSGSAFIQPDGGFTWVNLTGWAVFHDGAGRITSNNTYVSVTASMWIYPNQYVSQIVWPNVYVQFYRDEKYIGSAYMSGSIHVGGWPSGGHVFLNGTGWLNGSIYVQEAQ